MPTAPRIRAAEEDLLVLLARYVRVTAEQATRHSYSPSSLSHVRSYLNHLIDLGHVDAYRGFSRGGNPPFVYALSLKGWRYVEDHFGMPTPQRWKPGELPRTGYDDFLHDLRITDTGIAFERFCRAAAPHVTLVQFLHDRFLPQTKIPLPDATRPAMRLDGFVELHVRRDDAKKQRCHLFEIDRSTHYRLAIRKKFLLQLHYMQDGHYQRDFGTQSLSYLWICPGDDDRVTSLRKELEAVLREQQATDLAPFFLFTAADPARIDPLDWFLKPAWVTPFTPDANLAPHLPVFPESIRLDRSHYLPQEAYDRFLQANGDDLLKVTGELDLA